MVPRLRHKIGESAAVDESAVQASAARFQWPSCAESSAFLNAARQGTSAGASSSGGISFSGIGNRRRRFQLQQGRHRAFVFGLRDAQLQLQVGPRRSDVPRGEQHQRQDADGVVNSYRHFLSARFDRLSAASRCL